MTKITSKDKTVHNEAKINHRLFYISFILFLPEKIKKLFINDFLIYMAYKRINNLRGINRGHKDVRFKLSYTDVVYKIDC